MNKYPKKLQKQIKNKYVSIEKNAFHDKKYDTYLNVGVQNFKIIEYVSKKEAKWHSDMLVHALCDLVQQQTEKYNDLMKVAEELYESASYWSEYDVPIGIVDRLNRAIEAALLK